jgi:hypothetical protein
MEVKKVLVLVAMLGIEKIQWGTGKMIGAHALMKE